MRVTLSRGLTFCHSFHHGQVRNWRYLRRLRCTTCKAILQIEVNGQCRLSIYLRLSERNNGPIVSLLTDMNCCNVAQSPHFKFSGSTMTHLCSWSFLYSFLDRYPLIQACIQLIILANLSSRSSSIWPKTPARKNTCNSETFHPASIGRLMSSTTLYWT